MHLLLELIARGPTAGEEGESGVAAGRNCSRKFQKPADWMSKSTVRVRVLCPPVRIETMKMMYSLFLFGAEAAAGVTA